MVIFVRCIHFVAIESLLRLSREVAYLENLVFSVGQSLPHETIDKYPMPGIAQYLVGQLINTQWQRRTKGPSKSDRKSKNVFAKFQDAYISLIIDFRA